MKRDQVTTLLLDDEGDYPIECPYCQFTGLFSDLRQRYLDRSWWKFRKRESMDYLCPQCGAIIITKHFDQ